MNTIEILNNIMAATDDTGTLEDFQAMGGQEVASIAAAYVENHGDRAEHKLMDDGLDAETDEEEHRFNDARRFLVWAKNKTEHHRADE